MKFSTVLFIGNELDQVLRVLIFGEGYSCLDFDFYHRRNAIRSTTDIIIASIAITPLIGLHFLIKFESYSAPVTDSGTSSIQLVPRLQEVSLWAFMVECVLFLQLFLPLVNINDD